MKIHDTTVCFVNSRELSLAVYLTVLIPDLAAFATALERRRSDFQTLRKTLTFSRPSGEDLIPAYDEFLPEIRDRLLGVEDAHVLVRSRGKPLLTTSSGLET